MTIDPNYLFMRLVSNVFWYPRYVWVCWCILMLRAERDELRERQDSGAGHPGGS